MKIAIVRGGGVAGITTRTELSTEALEPGDADVLTTLVDAASIRGATRSLDARPQPDATLYEVTIDDDGDAVTETYSEQNLPESVRQLVGWVDGRPERTLAPEL